MTEEDILDTELKALYNAYWQGLQIRNNSEYLEYEAEYDISVWEDMVDNRKKIAEKDFVLEIAILTKWKKL